MKRINKSVFLGFTLIEIIITFAIIGFIAALVLVSFPSSQERARDTKRKDDIRGYSAILARHSLSTQGIYPIYVATIDITSLCMDLGLSGASCPNDPKYPAQSYSYQSNSTGTEFVLWAVVENSSDFWIMCSNGLTGLSALAPTGGVCPISVSTTITPATNTPTPTPTNTPAMGGFPTNTPTPSPTSTPALQTTVKYPTDDSYVTSSAPTTSYGNLSYFMTLSSFQQMYSYLKFSTPVPGTPVDAKLYLRRCSTTLFPSCTTNVSVTLKEVSNDTWAESTLNFNNRPAFAADLGTFAGVGSDVYQTINVFTYFISQSDTVISFGLSNSVAGSSTTGFFSKESGVGRTPYLEIKYY